MECQSVATSGAAPAGISAADISACLPVSVGRGSLVTEDQREVCPLSGRVISPVGSTLIRSVTDRRSLPPSSSTRRPIGSSCESLSLAGGRRAYHVSPICRGGEGRSYPPVVRHLRRGIDEPSNLTTCRFGPSVSASFACSHSRRLSLLHGS